MKMKLSRSALVLILLVVLVVLASGITYAVWSSENNSGKFNKTKVSQLAGQTSKYLVIEMYLTNREDTTEIDESTIQEKMFYMSYKDNANGASTDGAFVLNETYGEEYGGIKSQVELQTINISDYSARIIGYTGSLGQFEIIEIPPVITAFINNEYYKGSGSETGKNAIAIAEIAMQSPQEFPALNNIKQVRIPREIPVKGVSFSYCANLQKVIWLGVGTTRPANVSPDAFINYNPTIDDYEDPSKK